MLARTSWRPSGLPLPPETAVFTKPQPSRENRSRYRPGVEELGPREMMTAGLGGAAASLHALLPGRIGPLVKSLLLSDHIPGMGVAISYDGTVVLDQGYGVVGDKAKTPVTAATPFQVGSVTKTFTAIAILKIAEDSNLIDKTANPGITSLNLDAPLGNYFPAGKAITLPSLPSGQSFTLPPEWANLTPRELLDMSSGLPDDLDHTPWNIVVENLIRHRKAKPVFGPPGSRYLYSDLGFQVLGGLVEKLTNQTYAQFIQEHILTPLGMNETTVLTGAQTSVPGQAIGFDSYNPRQNKGRIPSGGVFSGASAFAAAGIVTSASDLGKYMSALWNESSELLSAASYQEMWTPVTLVSKQKPSTIELPGLGWDGVDSAPEGATIWKTGNVPGYQAEIALFRTDGVGIAVAFNLDNPNSQGNASAERVVAAIHAAVDAALAEATPS